MKRIVGVAGIIAVIILLVFLSWFLWEYKRIRKGMYQLAGLMEKEMVSSTFNLGEKDSLELESFKAVYLGKKSKKCKDLKKTGCSVALEFLSVDVNNNPIVFNVYMGDYNTEDFTIKAMVEADEEDSFGIVDYRAGDLIANIKQNDLTELYVISKINISGDVEDESLEKLTDLALDQQERTTLILNRFKIADEKESELVGLIKGFFGFRDVILPVYMLNIL